MSEHLPEFETDAALEAWFDAVDLGSLDLEEALEVQIGAHVELVIDEPWSMVDSDSASSATSGRIDADRDLVSA